MLSAPPHKKQLLREPLRDRRDSEVLAAEAEKRGEVGSAQRGADKRFARYLRTQQRQIGRNLDGIPLPTPGEVAFFISQKDINTFTLLLWLIEQAGGRLDSLFVTTFNVNQRIIAAFAHLLDTDQVGRLSIVLSQSITSRMPERIDELRQVWETRQDRMRVSLCWNHSKVAIARTPAAAYLLTGSGNYSFNAEIEQYEVWADADLCDWTEDVLERRCFAEARMNQRHVVWGVDG